MKPALVVLDPQNDFFGSDNPNLTEFEGAVPLTNAAISHFRRHGWPVIFVQHTSAGKPFGSRAWEIYPGFRVFPEAERITKTHMDAFWATPLDLRLSSHDVDFVLIAGFVAEYCVVATYRGAIDRGYKAAILKGAVGALDRELAQTALRGAAQISLEEMYRWLHYKPAHRQTGELVAAGPGNADKTLRAKG